MRILVIGGVQFMGRRIVERLLERGHDVTVLHRRATHDLGPQVRNLQADRGDLPLVAQLLRRDSFEAVFDLAYDWEKGTPATHVEAAARNCGDRLQRYVFVSSVAAYPPGLGLRESDALVPDDVRDPYTRCTRRPLNDCCSECIRPPASPSSRSARHSSTGRGSRSTGSSSSGTECSTGVRSCCRTAAMLPRSGYSSMTWPQRASARSTCRRLWGRRSTSVTSSR